MPLSTAIFLAAGAISLFAFLSVVHWGHTKAAERRTTERYALLRQVAERPAESARLVVELLREEDARLEEKAREKLAKASKDTIFGGWVLIAVGVGMAVMMASIADDQPNLWTIGLMPGLIGVAMIFYEMATGEKKGQRAEGRGQK